jgi:hypothetical protein
MSTSYKYEYEYEYEYEFASQTAECPFSLIAGLETVVSTYYEYGSRSKNS